MALEIAARRARIGELKAQLEDLWRGEQRAEYELTSVFVHRGSSPTFGHYFIYQRWLPDHPDEWFKYNDSDVSVVDRSDVLADTTGDTANPYLVRPFPLLSCKRLVCSLLACEACFCAKRITGDPDCASCRSHGSRVNRCQDTFVYYRIPPCTCVYRGIFPLCDTPSDISLLSSFVQVFFFRNGLCCQYMLFAR